MGFSNRIRKSTQKGFGEVVYALSNGNKSYSLICFANELNEEERSDRVIATKWDAAFALFDGIPEKEDIERLKNNVPLTRKRKNYL